MKIKELESYEKELKSKHQFYTQKPLNLLASTKLTNVTTSLVQKMMQARLKENFKK